jgi:hypothetical protein
MMSRTGVGHDGGRVTVHQHNFISLFLQGFAGLGSGIIKFTSLADDNGTGADNEDFLQVSSLGHYFNEELKK